jgi:hypothetical protein
MMDGMDTGFWQKDGETPAVELLATAVQVWTTMQGRDCTVGETATAFKTTPEKIAEAVKEHYWMLLIGEGPLEQQIIFHEGE